MVNRLTKNIHLNRGLKYFVLYGSCIEDRFITSALTEINLIALLDEYLNEHGFKNNILYHAEKSIRFLKQSPEESTQEVHSSEVRVKRLDLRQVPGAGKPPLEHSIVSYQPVADNAQFTPSSQNPSRFVSWSNSVDYFDAIMMKQTQKHAIIFMDSQNCNFDQRFLSCFSKWQIYSNNGSICIFIYPGEERPRTIGPVELDNHLTLENNDQLINIDTPCTDEIRNLLLRKRLFDNMSIDWSVLDKICDMFASVAHSSRISMKRLQSKEIFGSCTCIDQEQVLRWKQSKERGWMKSVGIKTIHNLHKKHNDLDIAALKKELAKVRCQQDITESIANKLNLWWYREKSKPLSFVLAGTSGTGKTFTMETLAQYLESYGYQYFLVDLTRFSSEADMNSLFGSPTGYIGSDTRPALFDKLRESGNKLVICFDELDKAYDEIMNKLMTLLDKGELSWNNDTEDFRNCIIGFTTNHKMDALVELKQKTNNSYTDQQLAAVLNDKTRFSPYNLGRLGSFYIYNQFNPEAIADICIREINVLASAYQKDRKILSVDPGFILEILIAANGSTKGGRAVINGVEHRLSTAVQDLLSLNSEDSLKLIKNGNSYSFQKAEPEEKHRVEKDKAIALRRFLEYEQRLEFMDEALLDKSFEHIKCQDDNIRKIKLALQQWYCTKKKEKPLSFFLVGPSGTGKTESAKSIHNVLEPYGYNYYSVACNTMQHQVDFYRLIGDPTSNQAQNTVIIQELLQTDNKLVICFDEVEKAFSGFFDGIMTLLQEGTLAGGNFKQCVIVLTSNLAQTELIQKKQSALLQKRDIEETEIHETLINRDPKKQIKETHLGRINHKLIYNLLSSDMIFDMALGMIKQEAKKFNIKQVCYVSPELMLQIILKTEGSVTGARAVQSHIEEIINPLIFSFVQINTGVTKIVLKMTESSLKNGIDCFECIEAETGIEYDKPAQLRKQTQDLYIKHKRRTSFIELQELKNALSPVACQDDSITEIIEYLRLEIPKKRERPMSLFFAGTTGTGKTFTAELIAKYMEEHGYGYHYETMTNYRSEHDASRFIGSAEGFVGSDSPPQIIVKNEQFGGKLVLVLDEFDKAHESAQEMIMQLLDKGIIQSNKKTADFSKALIIITSNSADRELVEYKTRQIQQGASITDFGLMNGIKEILRTHKMQDTFLARLGKILVFNPLSHIELLRICWNEASKTLKSYSPDIDLMHIDPNYLFKIVSSQESINYGARQIRDQVNNQVSKAYADSIEHLQDVLELSLILNDNHLEIQEYKKHKSKEQCILESGALLLEHSKKIRFLDPDELVQALAPVVSQDDNIEQIISYLRMEMARKTRKRPMSLLFAGTTGTGKTYTAELIAACFAKLGYGYHYETMTNYKNAYDASRFIGSAEGLVGSDSLPRIIQNNIKYAGKLVIVLDEFDKAHSSAQEMIMQLLDKGVIQSNKVLADFRKTLVILTSNAADQVLAEFKKELLKREIPASDPIVHAGIKDILKRAGMQDTFLARLGKILVFNSLQPHNLLKIAWQEIEKFLKDFDDQLKIMHVNPDLLVEIVNNSGSIDFGARVIRNLVEELVGPVYERHHNELLGTIEISLVKEESQLVLQSHSGEPTISECLSVAQTMLKTLSEHATLPTNEKIEHRIEYSRFWEKSATYSDMADFRTIVTNSVGLVESDEGSGSGFLITTDGLFVTCYHVIAGSKSIQVRFEKDLNTPFQASVIAVDEESDLALLELAGEGFEPGMLEQYGMEIEQRNEEVLIAGFPMPGELRINKVNFTKGNVSNIVKDVSNDDEMFYYHLNCNAYPGSSGGPVFSVAQKLIIGILQGGYDNTAHGVNVAISIQNLYAKLFIIDSSSSER